MFVDDVTIKVIAGKGGDGCLAFRREKFVAMGGPFGGNGGRGASIVFVADEGLNTLLDLRYKKEYKGHKGENGKGKGQDGAAAEDVIVKVPVGTVITDVDTSLILGDLKHNGDSVVVAKGGRGGRGNMAFKTRENKAPNFAENGEPGEERTLHVELKLLADVGLVGFPSVGKSTILSLVSRSKPKIADYHFTTLSPNLGVCKTKNGRTFVMADLPGLIEGASKGAGLGDKFLRHIERTRVIAHVIDMGGVEGRDAYKDYLTINKELEEFSPKLMKKPQIIIANKMDVEGSDVRLKEFKSKVKDIPIYENSVVDPKELDNILVALADLLESTKTEELYEDNNFESHVLYTFKEEAPYEIEHPSDHVFVVKGEKLEKLLKMTNFSTEESAYRFAGKLKRMGVDEKLKEMGAKEGDTVQILDFSFEYKE